MRNELKDFSKEELEAELERRKEFEFPVKWPGAKSLWHVTTEGDVEGKTITDLGVHDGHVGDIALRLAGHAFYCLKFKPAVSEKPLQELPGRAVDLQLDIGSGLWDIDKETRAEAVQRYLGEGFVVTPTVSYGCVHLERATE